MPRTFTYPPPPPKRSHRSKSSLLRNLERDLEELQYAARKNETNRETLSGLWTGDGLQTLVLQRIRESLLHNRKTKWAGHVIRRIQSTIYGIEISKNATIGTGVYFAHPLGIIIGGNSIVGERVRFFGNNTLGTVWDNGYPIIENDVTIGAGARILGPVTVGEGAIIGANAV
ncbi:MAG: serine O-acetyltransferase, partial [Myxococcota bacterium]